MLVPAATRPRNGGELASTPVSTTATALFCAVVGHAERAQVVQADQGAARRVGQVGRGLELPDALVVRGVQGRAVRREADGELELMKLDASAALEMSKP